MKDDNWNRPLGFETWCSTGSVSLGHLALWILVCRFLVESLHTGLHENPNRGSERLPAYTLVVPTRGCSKQPGTMGALWSLKGKTMSTNLFASSSPSNGSNRVRRSYQQVRARSLAFGPQAHLGPPVERLE